MKKKERRTIFYLSIILFFLASYFVVRYSFGYGFDIGQFKFVRTGAVSIITNPGSADVFLDDNFAGKTSAISNSLNKKYLSPDNYDIRIEKNGYKSYRKTLKVEPGEVVFVVANLFRSTYEPVENEKFNEILSSNSYRVEDIFREDGKAVIKTDNNFFLLEGSNISEFSIPLAVSQNVEDVLFRNNKIYFLTKDKIYSYEDERVNLIFNFNFDIDVSNNEIYYLNVKDVFLYKQKIDGSSLEQISKERLMANQEDIEDLKIKIIDSKVVLLVNGQFLYILNSEGSYEKFDVNGGDFKISPDKKKLVVWDDKEISVFWLEDEFHPAVSKKYSKELIVRLTTKIENVWWHKNSNDVLFLTGGSLKTAEVDGAGGRNQYEIMNGVNFAGYVEKQNDFIFYNGKLMSVKLD